MVIFVDIAKETESLKIISGADVLPFAISPMILVMSGLRRVNFTAIPKFIRFLTVIFSRNHLIFGMGAAATA